MSLRVTHGEGDGEREGERKRENLSNNLRHEAEKRIGGRGGRAEKFTDHPNLSTKPLAWTLDVKTANNFRKEKRRKEKRKRGRKVARRAARFFHRFLSSVLLLRGGESYETVLQIHAGASQFFGRAFTLERASSPRCGVRVPASLRPWVKLRLPNTPFVRSFVR